MNMPSVTNSNSFGFIRGPKVADAVVAFQKGTAKWREVSHQVAASCVLHAHVTGDYRPCLAMIEAMPKGVQTNSLRRYFESLAPLRWSESLKKFKFDATKRDPIIEGNAVKMEQLVSTYWWDFGKNESADNYKAFDMEARLRRLLKDAEKALENKQAGEIRETVTSRDVNTLNELINRMYAAL